MTPMTTKRDMKPERCWIDRVPDLLAMVRKNLIFFSGQGRRFRSGTPQFGEGFEIYIVQELTTYTDYSFGEPMSYWPSARSFEVDFIIGGHAAVEVQAKSNGSPQDLRALKSLAEEKKLRGYLYVSLDPRPRKIDGIKILPVEVFLGLLWSGEFS